MRIDYRIVRPIALSASFDVEGFTVLLGASGEGKTLLLRAIAGLLPARGEPFNGLPPQRRAVGYLPQGHALFPHLNAWQNVAFALSGPRRRMEAMAWLARVGLAELAERWPAQLSGGQQQRVALAWVRALGEFGVVLIVAYYPQGIPVKLWTNLQDYGLSAVYPLLWVFFLVALPLPLVLGLAVRRRLA